MTKYLINGKQVTKAEAKQYINDGMTATPHGAYYDSKRGYKVIETNGSTGVVGHYEEPPSEADMRYRKKASKFTMLAIAFDTLLVSACIFSAMLVLK